jgi:hypothetical protein
MKHLEICKKFMEENPGYEFFGIRADDRAFEVGQMLPNSFVWDDGVKTDEELDGTCAIRLYDYWTEKYNENAESQASEYPFDNVYLIAAKSAQEGNDRNELVMFEAVVVEIL